MRCVFRTYGLAIVLAVGVLCAAAGAEPSPALRWTETPLGELPQKLTPRQVCPSPDGTHAAYVLPLGWRNVVVLDGVQQDPYEWIVNCTVYFSADGRHTIYQARDRRFTFLVVDGKPLKPWETIDDWAWTADGEHLAYSARRPDGRYMAVIDGAEGKAYPRVRLGAISGSGRVAVVATVENGECLVLDGVEGKVYEHIFDVRFSADGKHVAGRALRGGKWRMLLDGAEGEMFDELRAPCFSPAGQRLGYVALRDRAQYFVVDGVVSRPFQEILMPSPVFSTDSAHVACAGRVDDRWVILLDGAEKGAYAYVDPHMSFSPDGRLVYIARKGASLRLIVAEREGTGHDAIPQVCFSPDGKRMAYIAVGDAGSSVILDGVAGKAYEQIDPRSLAFSPDGGHIAFSAERGKKWFVVVDGTESRPFDAIPLNGALSFDREGALNFIAVRDRQVLRVRAVPTSKP